MQFRFSKKVTIVCTALVLLMLRASYWQYTRYLEKTVYIQGLMARLDLPIQNLDSAFPAAGNDWQQLLHRRVTLDGSWDYEHEFILRNRQLNETPGGFVITPLKTKSGAILVSRGFIPLQLLTPEKRQAFRKENSTVFTGLIKETTTQKLFAPSDPPSGGDNPWVDQWLRVDIAAIQKQIPYPLAPVYAERMPDDQTTVKETDLLVSKSNRDEIFMPGANTKLKSFDEVPEGNFPIPTYDTIIPPGRHYSYIFEWAIMAGMTIIIALILQLKRI